MGVVLGLLRQHLQTRVLTGDQLVVLQRESGVLAPDAVGGDLVGDLRPAHPLGAAVGVRGALPGHRRGVLLAAEEGVRVGVVDPAEPVPLGDEPVGQRVGTVVLLAVLDAAGGVVGQVEGEAVLVLPGGGVVDVRGRHADGVGLGVRVGAVDVAGRAVQLAVPAVVGGEHVVDVHGEVVPRGAQVHTVGHPLHDAAGQQPELLLVPVVDEGDDELAPPVVPVLAHQRALLRLPGDGRLDVRGEVRAGGGRRQIGVTLADVGGVVLEGHRSLEVAEGAGLARGGHLGLDAVDAAGVAAGGRVLEPGLRTRVGVGVDLRDRVGPLVVRERRHLGGAGGEGVVVRQDDGLVLGARPAVHRVGEEAGVDHGSAGPRQVDLRVRRSRRVEFGRDGPGGRAAVAHHQDPQVDAGRGGVGVCRAGRQAQRGDERAHGQRGGAYGPLHAVESPPPGRGEDSSHGADAPPGATPASPSEAGRRHIRRVT